MKAAKLITIILVIVLVAGYFVANAVVHRKVEMALRGLPASLRVSYSRITTQLFRGAVSIDGLSIRFPADGPAHSVTVGRLSAGGIGFWTLLRRKRLTVNSLRLDSCIVELDDHFADRHFSLPEMEMPFDSVSVAKVVCAGLRVSTPKETLSAEGDVELDGITRGREGPGIEGIHVSLARLRYLFREGHEIVSLRHLDLDSKKRLFQLDTLHIVPSLDKFTIGKENGHQTDVVEAMGEGISATGLDVRALVDRKLTAEGITMKKSRIYIFRDRRLPLKPGEKPLPIEGLRDIPVALRVGKVRLGPTHFIYEEYPKKGDSTGILQIYHFSGTLAPLINRPGPGDPAYLTMTTEGSLMNSGSVTAIMKMPLHPGEPYLVEGAFHDLDVTRLNNPAEHLGELHLESGLLNKLDFQFAMTDEKATGRIIGEYHDLVVDKLEDNGKVAGFKSFMLKKFIIPRNKDKSLEVKKRTGKVDYHRDKSRYFSYYLLHSLLVGIKSSFRLGFLLPG
jgi:hypothetical protein